MDASSTQNTPRSQHTPLSSSDCPSCAPGRSLGLRPSPHPGMPSAPLHGLHGAGALVDVTPSPVRSAVWVLYRCVGRRDRAGAVRGDAIGRDHNPHISPLHIFSDNLEQKSRQRIGERPARRMHVSPAARWRGQRPPEGCTGSDSDRNIATIG